MRDSRVSHRGIDVRTEKHGQVRNIRNLSTTRNLRTGIPSSYIEGIAKNRLHPLHRLTTRQHRLAVFGSNRNKLITVRIAPSFTLHKMLLIWKELQFFFDQKPHRRAHPEEIYKNIDTQADNKQPVNEFRLELLNNYVSPTCCSRNQNRQNQHK